MRPVKEQFAVDWRVAKAGIELVEMGATELQFIREDIGESDHLRCGVFSERSGDGGAAIAAAQQAKADGGVGLITEGGGRLEQKQATGGSGLEKLSTVHYFTIGQARLTAKNGGVAA